MRVCDSELFVRGGEITPVQTEAYLNHQRLLWQLEANGFVFIDGSCDIERKAHSSNSSRPPPHSPSSRVRLRSSLLQTDALIDQRGEWPFYYPLENRADFFFLLSDRRCLCCRQKSFSGFGCCFSRSRFWGWHPTGSNYGSWWLCSPMLGGAALGKALTLGTAFWSGAGGEHTINRASMHHHTKSFSISKRFF